MDKSVPRVTVWHHEALPSDAKQLPEGQICPFVPNTNDSFSCTFLCQHLNYNFTLKFYLEICLSVMAAILF